MRGYYFTEETNNGWAIFLKYDEKKKGKFIANQLSQKQANKWCKRLNDAYDEGAAYMAY